MSLTPGAVLKDDFVLEAPIGEGAMGVVWSVRHRTLGNRVAAKILQGAALVHPEAFQRFERETRAVARIDSPHVVKIFDVGQLDGGRPFYLMELLSGRDLGAVLAERGRLSVEETASILGQIALALDKAHALGVIHRDLKPANTFLCDGGATPLVKVLDFGIAKVAGSEDAARTSTQALLGTPFYMSPEQFVNARTIDHRADLWSVGVIAYECLTGQRPFTSESVGGLAVEVHKGAVPSVRARRPELPPALDAWFQRALAVEPSARYPSASAMAEAFAIAARGTSLPPSAPNTSTAAFAATYPRAASPESPPVVPHARNEVSRATTDRSATPWIGPTVASPGAIPPSPGARSSSAVLVIGAALALTGVAAFAFAFVLPRLQAEAPADEDETAEHVPAKKKRKASASASESAAPTAAPSPEPSPVPTDPAAPSADSQAPSAVATPSKTSGSPGPSPTGSVSAPAAPAASASAPAPSATIPDTTGLSGVLFQCWRAEPNPRPASSASLTMKMPPQGNMPEGINVSGPAASVGAFRSCVMNNAVAHARFKFGDREAGKSVTTGTVALPECIYDKAAHKLRCGE